MAEETYDGPRLRRAQALIATGQGQRNAYWNREMIQELARQKRAANEKGGLLGGLKMGVTGALTAGLSSGWNPWAMAAGGGLGLVSGATSLKTALPSTMQQGALLAQAAMYNRMGQTAIPGDTAGPVSAATSVYNAPPPPASVWKNPTPVRSATVLPAFGGNIQFG